MNSKDLHDIIDIYSSFGVPVAEEAWRRYDQDHSLRDELTMGDRVSLGWVRNLTLILNRESRDPRAPGLRASDVATAELLTDILRYLWNRYCTEEQPGVSDAVLDHLRVRGTDYEAEASFLEFLNMFVPVDIRRKQLSPRGWLDHVSHGLAGPSRVLREMILVKLSLENKALSPMRTLFDSRELNQGTWYGDMVDQLEEFFSNLAPATRSGEPLLAVLRGPMNASPDSIEGQLEFISRNWGELLPPELLKRVTFLKDISREETTMRGMGPGRPQVLRFEPGRGPGAGRGGAEEYPEVESFSPDSDWMSNVVLVAKSAYVWLDQISRKYGREIYRLDQIPDQELDQLRDWGFNGLWLIGLWERSAASKRIKQMMGNPEAVASAYSLHGYSIAADLGGGAALESLKHRARERGIRLAADMVPNHTGVDSTWMVDHPERFIQAPVPPFPVYSFQGPDICGHPEVDIRIEDGYWNRSDAAVVFQRRDNRTGQVTYIYHGNDGTSMPWNDTAQLNFLLPEVREAVIQTILEVARSFPIIRFDAAMTLAKKHFQRLWYPKAGDAGAIPSRAEYGMTREEFDQVFPIEFWREVVDRVAVEVPDTLLLAEAFWLMEGYFVRTLGMHRVYNSAFMHMLKNEENAKFRETISNVLEFSPEILKRFVNFMNNPDEETARIQFGTGDKYFGICMLMVTMPGLPMFGHGQVEGYSEKYGMEYRRAYWDEHPDTGLIRHHESQIAPLMSRRELFSGVENFNFFDLVTSDGWVDQNVYAYTNRFRDQRCLVVYNNSHGTTSGTINRSVVKNTGTGEAPSLRSVTLLEALGLNCYPNDFLVMRDHQDGLEYIESCRAVTDRGLFLTLGGYRYRAFLDIRVVNDGDGTWDQLSRELGGRGVADAGFAVNRLKAGPMIQALVSLVDRELPPDLASLEEFYRRCSPWFPGLNPGNAAARARDLLATSGPEKLEESELEDQRLELICALLRPLCRASSTGWDTRDLQTSFLREGLDRLARQDSPGGPVAWTERLLAAGSSYRLMTLTGPEFQASMADLLKNGTLERALLMSTHQGIRWMNRESLDEFLGIAAGLARAEAPGAQEIAANRSLMLELGEQAGWDVGKTCTLLKGEEAAVEAEEVQEQDPEEATRTCEEELPRETPVEPSEAEAAKTQPGK